jgi:hypothetical protein
MKKDSIIKLEDLKTLEMGPKWENDNKIFKKPINDERSHKPKTRKVKTFGRTKRHNEYTINPNPDSGVLTNLLNKIRKVGITYELNEIFDVFVKDKNKLSYKIDWKEDKKFYVTKYDKIIFCSKKELISYVMQNQIDKFFDKRTVEENSRLPIFSTMLKCPKTNKLLPPNSYHDFKKYIIDHIHENNIMMEFERYCKNLETVRDASEIKDFRNIKKTKYYFTKKNKAELTYSLINIERDVLENKDNLYFYEQNTLKLNYKDLKSLKFNVEVNLKNADIKNNLYKNLIIALKRSGFHLIKHDRKTYATWIKNKSYDYNLLSELSKSIIDRVKRKPITKKKLLLKSFDEIDSTKESILIEILYLVKEGYLRELADSTIIIG